MTRDEIIRMANEACEPAIVPAWDGGNEVWKLTQEEIERFAALVVEAEREACAKVCEQQGKGRKALEHYAALTYSGSAHDCAAAIRAREEK